MPTFKSKKQPDGTYTSTHKETKEPMFTGRNTYGREISFDWHPYMKELHPGLVNSQEHGKDGLGGEDKFYGKDKSEAESRMYHIHAKAEAVGFKDKLKTERRPVKDSNDNHINGYFVHDPETNELIAHNDQSLNHTIHNNPYNQIYYNPEYLKAHDIDETAVKNLKGTQYTEPGSRYVNRRPRTFTRDLNPYTLATGIHALKGVKYKAIGEKSIGGRTTIYNLKTHPDNIVASMKRHLTGMAEDWKNHTGFGEHTPKEYNVIDHGKHGFTIHSTQNNPGDHFHHTFIVAGDKAIHTTVDGIEKSTSAKIK